MGSHKTQQACFWSEYCTNCHFDICGSCSLFGFSSNCTFCSSEQGTASKLIALMNGDQSKTRNRLIVLRWDTGECEHSLSPTANMLRKHGIRPILNYAAEDDVSSSPVQVQCQDTAAELVCDRNMLPFLKSIEDSGNREGKGFIQAKVCQSSIYLLCICR